jgi:hypothetical protein
MATGSPHSAFGSPEKKHFQFIVIEVDGSEPETVSATLARIYDIFGEHQATYPSIAGGLLISCLGTFYPEMDSPELRTRIVNTVLSRLGDKVRIMHGQCDGIFGIYGSTLRSQYDAIIPGFTEIHDELRQMDYGTAKEVLGP